jgi:hypothetical protein
MGDSRLAGVPSALDRLLILHLVLDLSGHAEGELRREDGEGGGGGDRPSHHAVEDKIGDALDQTSELSELRDEDRKDVADAR